MPRFDTSITVQRPPEEVFDFIADPDNIPRWDSTVVASRRLSPGPLNVGTRFEERIKMGPSEMVAACELTSFERPRRVGFKVSAKVLEHQGTFEIQERRGQTLLRFVGRCRPRGLLRLLTPLVALRVKLGIRKELRAIKSNLESAVP